jgi:hypothetical protein
MEEWKCTSYTILNLAAGWTWVVSVTPRPLYHRGNSSLYPLYRRLRPQYCQNLQAWRICRDTAVCYLLNISLTSPKMWPPTTVFIGAWRWSLSWARWIKSTSPSCFSKIHFIIILPLTSSFPIRKPVCILPSHPSLCSRFERSKTIGRRAGVMELLIMTFFPAFVLFHPSRSKYSVRHPVCKHCQYMCFQ